MSKKYPSTTSRTLDPANRSLATVVGQHDRRITDADINLIQDLQDYKRGGMVENMVFSGALQQKPFQFNTSLERSFFIPAFDVMFNGETVTIGGNHSADLTLNKVLLPLPNFWAYGQATDSAAIYVVYLELWYRSLNPADAAGTSGYYIDENGIRFIYPNGCIDGDPSNLIPDDVLDPFQGLNTTTRAQVQWTIRAQRVPLSYDFTVRRFGLDPLGDGYDAVFGRGYLPEPPTDNLDNPFPFINLGTVNGDFGLWRAGDGAPTPVIPTMDGYTYAMPLAVVFQRNTGQFNAATNPNGCADAKVSGSGVLSSGISGRYDARYADAVYPEDVVDTRLTVSLTGYDWAKTLKNGFVDLINGNLSQKIGRGETPGSDPTVLGSILPYTVALGPEAVVNTDHLGSFDGFMNGFGHDARTFYTVKAVSVNNKSVGTNGVRWTKGDAFSLDLDATGARLGAVITYVMVQALVLQADGVSYAPVLLLSGQISVSGLGTRKATGTIARELLGTPFDPGLHDLYITVGVAYEAGSNFSLKKVPQSLAGGLLHDAGVNRDFRVFGVSEYATSRTIEDQTHRLTTYNPLYSNKVFGARVEVVLPATSGVAGTFNALPVLTFTIDRLDLNHRFDGLYVVSASNLTTGVNIPLYYTAVDPGHLIVKIPVVPTTANISFTIMLDQTAQLSYNPAVKAVTAINETVLFGNYISSTDFQMDQRLRLISTKYTAGNGLTSLVFAGSDGQLTGIGGTANNKFIFVADDPGNPTVFRAYPLLDVQFFNGVTTVTVPASALVNTYPYFLVGSFAPAFTPDSTMALTLHYLPYQGEGNPSHTYSVLHSEDFALVTTNGTGAAPIVGLKDIYPYNRELPISTLLPAQPTWNDAELANQAVSNYFDGNYEAKRFNNVEHTFITPLHSNDFIEPVGGWKRKKLKLSFQSGRGFAKVSPHIGFAIRPPKPRVTLGEGILTSVAPIQIYVDNVHGNDSFDGYSPQTPKRSIPAAVMALPPVLRHPCAIYLIQTSQAYKIKDLKNSLKHVYLGDGDVQPLSHHCIAGLSLTLQDEGRLYVGRAPGSTDYVEITAEGYTGFGDGPTSAFVVTDTRVVFSGIRFKGFTDPAIYAVDTYVDFVDCDWVGNFVAGSFTDGSSATISKCSLSIAAGTGFILSDSSLTVSETRLTQTGSAVNSFFVCERTSNLTLAKHKPEDDTNVTVASTIVLAKLNSTVVCTKDYSATGKASLISNSVLTRTVDSTPFGGGISTDTSSQVMTDIS